MGKVVVKKVRRTKKTQNKKRVVVDSRLVAPANEEELRGWVRKHCGLVMPTRCVCGHHVSPMAYLTHVFFTPGDCVVWACRGGGKTQLGAVATLLEMLFRPGIQIRILGGSLEQSARMYAHLCKLADGKFRDLVVGKVMRRGFKLNNGSSVELLAQSERSVRGTRVQRVRCDEVELFATDVWEAAQLTTRSLVMADRPEIPASIEALSTAHRTGGLMEKLVKDDGRKVFSWCALDVMQQCKDRACEGCPLWDECQGRGRQAEGFVPVADLIKMKGRVSKIVWEQEMLCRATRSPRAVYDGFSVARDVRAFDVADGFVRDGQSAEPVELFGGIDFGFRRFVWLGLAMTRGENPTFYVVDEMIGEDRPLSANVAAMQAQNAANLVYCDAAGVAHNSQTGATDVTVLRRAGFTVRYRPMNIIEGVRLIQELISPASGAPRLVVHPRCVRTIAALKGYQWAENGDAIEKDGEHDHLMDALRYAVCGMRFRMGTVVRAY